MESKHPFSTIEEQISLLESRGVATNEATGFILRCEGYYSIVNGYKDVFIDREATMRAHDDRFVMGTTFDDIYELFSFDRSLRMLMLKYFILAETRLRTACSYCFSRRYSDLDEPYLDPCSYDRNPTLVNSINRLIESMRIALYKDPDRLPDHDHDYIRHYVDRGEPVPLWVLMNAFSIGQTFKFFCFQKESMRNEISRYFSELYKDSHNSQSIRLNPRQVQLAFDHIKDFRNICAHDERFFCARVSPARDITFARVLEDLQLFQSENESRAMLDEVSLLLDSVKLGESTRGAILHLMGLHSVCQTVGTLSKE